MECQIKRIYLGLPDELKEKVFRVGRVYRTNPLSHIEGGIDVVIDYCEGLPKLYDWVKDSTSYVFKILRNQIVSDINKIEVSNENEETAGFIDCSYGRSLAENILIIKRIISAIYFRQFNRDNFSRIPFVKVWDNQYSENTPWHAIQNVNLHNS
jgi:hypothetical protein